MKRMKTLLLPVAIVLLLSSCGSHKEIAYMQDGQYLKYAEQQPFLYDAHILPKDLIAITVSCSEPELSAPFNLGGNLSSGTTANATTTPQQSYLVDNNGDIDFPILGKLHIGGMTKGEAEALICGRLKSYLKEDPIVNVRMINYKFTVLGEVAKPNTFTVANEKVNIFEALAMAGDMTIFGKRGNVKLLREDEKGRKEIIELNLKDPGIVMSPYYYSQQNDIVYVEPNKSKIKNASMTSITPWVSILSVLTSLTSIGVVIFR